MRKLLISLMATSVFLSTAAYAEDGDFLRAMRNSADRSNHTENNSDRRSPRSHSSQRVERSSDDRPPRVERMSRSERQPRIERVEQIEGLDHGDRSLRRAEPVRRPDQDGQQVERIERTDGSDRRVSGTERVRRLSRDVPQIGSVQPPEQVQTQPTEGRREGLAGAFSRVDRDTAEGSTSGGDGRRDWRRDRDGDRDWRREGNGRHRWHREWRRDGRYDWSSYRNRYRSLFRLGRYYDPYGWGYRRFSIGFDLWPSYYGSSFWLRDPWRYRLPPAYGQYRWIRYYDDALLVNIYTGQVIDVIHNLFW